MISTGMAKNPLQNFVVEFASGQPVFHEGDVGATMYIVQSGRVRLFHDATDHPVAGNADFGRRRGDRRAPGAAGEAV